MNSFYMPKTPLVIKNSLYDYCLKSTNESIRKKIENYNLEKNKKLIKNLLDDSNGNEKPEFNFYNILVFLSVSTIGLFLYKRLH